MPTNRTVTHSLQNTVIDNPHVEQVHFTEDGNYHFRVFETKDGLYTRLREVPEETKSGISTTRFMLAPIKKGGVDDPAHKVVETVSREDILSATPVADPTEKPVISKLQILDILGISDEDLAKILKSKTK